MKTISLLLAVCLVSGCTIKNNALRGAVAGVIYGPAGVNTLNEGDRINDGSLNGAFPEFIHGSAVLISFVFNPVVGGIYLGFNAFYGGFETHYHFKRKKLIELRDEKNENQ